MLRVPQHDLPFVLYIQTNSILNAFIITFKAFTMATRDTKQIGKHDSNKGSYLTKENWEVMKPFVHFSAKALLAIGSVLWAVVKFVPKALEHKPERRKNDKVIKI
jgi:hypothetical protein